MAGRSSETAQTLILIGLIFQLVSFLILLGVGFFLLIIPILGGIVLFLAFISLIWLLLVYIFSYAPARNRDFEDARTPTLVFGILTLISGGFISGILYIVAYVNLGDALDEEQARTAAPRASATALPYVPPARFAYSPGTPVLASPAMTPPPSPPIPLSSFYCSSFGRPTPPHATYCRNCGPQLA
ncbi:MAG: hypothetical protein WAN87_07805 [Thermoplasmata archaeon]